MTIRMNKKEENEEKSVRKTTRVVSSLDMKILSNLPYVGTKFQGKLCMTYVQCECLETTA